MSNATALILEDTLESLPLETAGLSTTAAMPAPASATVATAVYQSVPNPPISTALATRTSTPSTDMEATIACTITSTIMVALNTTGNTDVVGTSGLQLNGATVWKIDRHGQNTDDGLLPPDMIYAVALASDCAFPFLLCNPDYHGGPIVDMARAQGSLTGAAAGSPGCAASSHLQRPPWKTEDS